MAVRAEGLHGFPSMSVLIILLNWTHRPEWPTRNPGPTEAFVDERNVLGIDLACKSWADNGSARLTFGGTPSAWRECQPGCVRWPDATLTPAAMARALDAYATAHGIRAISID